VHVITVSTRAAAGQYVDRSGPALVDVLAEVGVPGATLEVVADDEQLIIAALRRAISEQVDAVLTTGGTGLAPTDCTPEATSQVVERPVPGLAEAIRATGREQGVATAVLSRGIAGVTSRTLIVNLPGSVSGARDGARVVGPLLAHVRDQLAGGDH
jgi:molybdenum cofactor synthesis domain-containing protein